MWSRARPAILAGEFAQRFDGFSIGLNDLTQLVLGVDRDSAELSGLFDERDEAVKRMIDSDHRDPYESAVERLLAAVQAYEAASLDVMKARASGRRGVAWVPWGERPGNDGVTLTPALSLAGRGRGLVCALIVVAAQGVNDCFSAGRVSAGA